MRVFRYIDCRITVDDERTIQYRDTYRPQPMTGLLRTDQDGDPLVRDTIERLATWVGSEDNFCARDDLQLLGRHLYYFLLDDQVRSAFESTYEGFRKTADETTRLRVVLAFREDASRISAFPWEFLFMPTRGPGGGFFLVAERRTELILTRFVPDTDPVDDLPPHEGKLKVLIAFCNPKELGGKLDADEFLSHMSTQSMMSVRIVENQTAEELAKHFKDFHPDVFHFIGHGDPHKGVALSRDLREVERDYVETGGQWKDVAWADSRQLQSTFQSCPPRLVFLHACHGAAPDSLSSFSSTARSLVYSHRVPSVIAMQYVISNESAQQFADVFYQQIAAGVPIDVAVSEGRWALRRSSRGEWADRQFATPLVYVQAAGAIVLHKSETRKDADGQPEPEQHVAQRCPYRDACQGRVYATDTVCVRCRRPVTACDEGHALAPEFGVCPYGHGPRGVGDAVSPEPAQAFGPRRSSLESTWQRRDLAGEQVRVRWPAAPAASPPSEERRLPRQPPVPGADDESFPLP